VKYVQKLKQWAKEIAFTLLLIFIVSNAISYFRAPKLDDTTLPSITATLIDKQFFSTHDYKNKPLLIHFWATWCPACRLEASSIQALCQEYNVLTIAVKSGSDATINAYLTEHGLSFKVINDQDGRYAEQFRVPAFPATFIYDAQNRLAFSEVGYTSEWALRLRMWWAGRQDK
jgi:thiol-disulfide isomerase/thioredoxin